MIMVWHYENWRVMPGVVAEQCLRPTNEAFSAGSPLLWFTTDQQWDRTSADDVLGSVRFGLRANDSRLAPWWQVFVDAGADPSKFVATLELCGADREEWFAVPEAVPLFELAFEVMQDGSGDRACSLDDKGLAWKPADPAVVARAYCEDVARGLAERDSGA